MVQAMRTKNWISDKSVQRCEAMVTVSLTGRRCPYDAEPDSDPVRCWQHLHVHERRGDRGHHMSRYYLKALRPTLAKKLEEAVSDESFMADLDVSEELGLMRQQASDAIEQYAVACEVPGEKGLEMRLVSGALMAERLKEVKEMAIGKATIEKTKIEMLDQFAGALQAVITCVCKSLWEVYGDDHRIADVEKKLRDMLVARDVRGIDGTEITPDQDVIEMDDSVPRAEEPV